ncbi:MAG TPA: hypothetical protein VIV64_10000 [Gammaproteobacteria bacterium]|jgi:hypothetical protein
MNHEQTRHEQTRHERELAEKAGRLFDESVERLDGATLARLAQARARAVEAAESGRPAWIPEPARLVPIGGVAAAALVLALIWPGAETPVGPEQAAVVTDLDLLLEGENLDLFEDLEFYAWLLEQPELLESDEAADGSG